MIDRDGTIVTNAHVVGDAERARVRFGDDRRRARGRGARHRPVVRPRRAEGRPLTRSADRPAAARRLRQGRRRRRRGGDRPSVRARPHRDRGDRLRARPRDPGAQRLPDRRGDPDRRPDQPRQLRRPAARLARAGDRRELADRHRRGAAATWASASRCPPTPCARWCRGCAAASRSSGPTSASPPPGAGTAPRRGGEPGGPGAPTPGCAPAHGDVIVRIDGRPVSEPGRRVAGDRGPGARRHGGGRGGARRRAGGRSRSSSATRPQRLARWARELRRPRCSCWRSLVPLALRCSTCPAARRRRGARRSPPRRCCRRSHLASPAGAGTRHGPLRAALTAVAVALARPEATVAVPDERAR